MASRHWWCDYGWSASAHEDVISFLADRWSLIPEGKGMEEGYDQSAPPEVLIGLEMEGRGCIDHV